MLEKNDFVESVTLAGMRYPPISVSFGSILAIPVANGGTHLIKIKVHVRHVLLKRIMRLSNSSLMYLSLNTMNW